MQLGFSVGGRPFCPQHLKCEERRLAEQRSMAGAAKHMRRKPPEPPDLSITVSLFPFRVSRLSSMSIIHARSSIFNTATCCV